MFHLFETINANQVYVIAEMSANHGGKIENALEIVRQAAKAGANCLKIQTYTADSMTIDCDREPFHITDGLWAGYNLYALYQEACTPYEWQKEIKEECEMCGIDFLSTPFDRDAVDFLESIGAEAFKIASFELVDIPLIEYAASMKKPMIISCGMGSVHEIQDAINACKKQGNDQIVLLKCCSEYPANWGDMHLGNIADMKERFGTLVGLSDHSVGSIGAVVGVALGACVVEKHIKIDGVKSPDSEFSMTVKDFAQMVDDIKAAKKISQRSSYSISESEIKSKVFRRSIFSISDIEEGDIFSENNIRVIRPSNGISPKYYHEILGRRSTRKIIRGEPILAEDIKDWNSNEANNEFELRSVEEGDINLLFTWANDPIVRKNAFHTEQIPFEDHKKWFAKLLRDTTQKQYIFMKDGQPIGQIRFSFSDNEAEIDYSISPDMRGCGYGKIMLEHAMVRFHKDFPNIKKLIGQVKVQNHASGKCFENCGFTGVFHQYEFEYKE